MTRPNPFERLYHEREWTDAEKFASLQNEIGVLITAVADLTALVHHLQDKLEAQAVSRLAGVETEGAELIAEEESEEREQINETQGEHLDRDG